MRYTSTRSRSISVSFEEALCSGYASDGGLFVPQTLPPAIISLERLQLWASLDYPQLAFEVLRLFIDPEEIGDTDLQRICFQAFQGFPSPTIAVPVVKVGNVFVAELFHGPTFCFKDLGMQVVIRLLAYFANKRQRHVTLVLSTTGDTGPAAVQAVCDVNCPHLSVLVHYPQGQISNFQRKQLTTVPSNSVKIVTYQGGGDDMDKPIKHILLGGNKTTHHLIRTGVNSTNIGRPLMQMVHYIWTHLRVCQALQQPFTTVIDMVLPTGAMGNMAGGYMAKKMGLPIGKLLAGVNANDATHRVFSTGILTKQDMIPTLSEAINVQIPYNLERLLFYITNGNHDLVTQWMQSIDSSEQQQQLTLSDEWLEKLQQDFGSARVTDDHMCFMMKQLYEQHHYFVDPHTAVAFAAAQQLGLYRNNNNNNIDDHDEPSSCSSSSSVHPTALLATASPCKFEEAVTIALGRERWVEYELSTDFPPGARVILQQVEIPPVVYPAREGNTLEQNQVEWEAMTEHLVSEFERRGR